MQINSGVHDKDEQGNYFIPGMDRISDQNAYFYYFLIPDRHSVKLAIFNCNINYTLFLVQQKIVRTFQ
jgi:hypothetical protein